MNNLLQQLEYNRIQREYLQQQFLYLQQLASNQDTATVGDGGYGGSDDGYGRPQTGVNYYGGQAVGASVYGNIPWAGPAQSNAVRYDLPVPPTGRAPNRVYGGEAAPYHRSDSQSGRGRNVYSNAPASFPTRGGSSGGYHGTNFNVQNDGQNTSIYQTQLVAPPAGQNLRPVRVNVANPASAAPTADRVEEVHSSTLAASESGGSSEEEDDDNDDDDDDDDDDDEGELETGPGLLIGSLGVPEEALAQEFADFEAARACELETVLAPATHSTQGSANPRETPDFLARFQQWKAGLEGTAKAKAPVQAFVQVSAPSKITKAERKRQKAERRRLRKASYPPNKGGKFRRRDDISTVWDEEQSIRAFIMDPNQSSINLGSMKKQKRMLVRVLARIYHLECTGGKKKKGQGIVLTKTAKTWLAEAEPYQSGSAPHPLAAPRSVAQVGGGSNVDMENHYYGEGEVVAQRVARVTVQTGGYRLSQHMVEWSVEAGYASQGED